MSIKLQVQDNMNIAPITSREFTSEGFLRVPAHVARTGVQLYKASELGLEGDPERVIRVYRPEDEVFNPKSLEKYNGIDITIEHPDNFVNSSNYKELTCGVVKGAGQRDGDHVKCELVVKDKDAIERIMNGKEQLSVGYEALYVEDPTGEYDFIQREIDPNHLAITDRARAGYKTRIFDSEKGNNMKRKVTIDSVEIEVDEKVAAHIAQLTTDKETLKAERDNERAEVKRVKNERKEDDYDVEKLRAEVKRLKDEKEESNKKKVSEDARKLVGDSVQLEGETSESIKRKALDSIGFDTSDKTSDYVNALFDMQLANRSTVDTQHRQIATDSATDNTVDTASFGAEARDGFINRLTGGK